ncbi:[glutamate--ammonia-ligase] adenylyltransferase [Paralimibaculum aggregatum]|uniref:[glutamate--ammonia-ligase] adenylyltransferase n=1 Tax=Paralimibaculum aggregatum TaxID=3036245 RepID=A0ABQ6LHR2_9RHOB|nr:bifunctional [glutamine synthetase] adenylyltransferase/[glutamine synthetase]-adenylyl-L-tyrosine phosphorylase [Limibaculum sp. NKW23]GMG82527.1 [glutamate--ammonia-ligase] adenylyltransferase [Limibaculum sp. NKW23]
MTASLESRLSRAPVAHDRERADALMAGLPAALAAGPLGELLHGTAGSAPYLARLTEHHAAWLEAAVAQAPEDALDDLLATLAAEVAEAGEEKAVSSALRLAKSRAALLIALADLGGAWCTLETTGALTRLAEGCLSGATGWLLAEALRRKRLPGIAEEDLATGAGYAVIAMGKLGAGELNYSSDIDLICLFDEGRFDPADYAEAKAGFIRVTRGLVRLMADQTAEGYVFRTDLRLRPAPSTTPVCMAMEPAERYYESLGRTWERAAHIKARTVAGDIAAGQGYLQRLAPFVWRKHLDFAAIEDTHDMLRKIREKKGKFTPAGLPGHDLKLGPGGIREIEFFAQTRQLIGGGRHPEIRSPRTLEALAALAALGWVERGTAATLSADYTAHRDLEHRLQMVEDAQTQIIPQTAEARARVAALAGWDDLAAWERDVADRLARVHRATEAFFGPGRPPRKAEAQPFEITAEWLAAQGFERPEDACRRIERWRSGSLPATRSQRSRRLYAGLEPRLIAELARAGRPDEAIAEFDRFLSGLPAGVQVFSLFSANPHLLDLIVGTCALAPKLAAHLGSEPKALDALLTPDFFEPLPGTEALTADLEDWVAREADYEGRLDAARRWARETRFRAGLQVLKGKASAEEAGAAFSAIAEACLAVLLPRVIDDFASRHGPPPGVGLAVIAMGKLGSGEMTAGSDLDLIIVYDAGDATASEGRRPLSPSVYYPRLTQALVAALTAPTAEGRLYEVDMRLRPSGRQGPVAVSLAAFESYQREKAWVWEHMALTRARVVTGEPGLGARVEAVIAAALESRAGAPEVLAEAREMRVRLLEAHAKERARPWSLKHTAGGLMEIEFLAQTGALLRGLAGTRRVTEVLPALGAAGWISAAEADELARAHALQSHIQQIERVALETPFDGATAGAGLKAAVAAATGFEDFAALEAALGAAQAGAAAVVERIFADVEEAGSGEA